MIWKINGYLKVLTDDEVKGFVVENFAEYFKSMKEKLYSKLNKEHSFRKVAESLYFFLTTPDKIEKFVNMMQKSSKFSQEIQFKC